MARIRSIKPELRTSITVSLWPREVRYFFILLWGYLDDYGHGVDDELLIAADCFPRDRDVTPEMVDGWLELMADAGPVCRYEVDGRRYLHCPNWHEHQRPQHPGQPRTPPCPIDDADAFRTWRENNMPRENKRSRRSHEGVMKTSPAHFCNPGGLISGGENKGDDPSDPPADFSDDDDQGTGAAAGQPLENSVQESLMSLSGERQETVSPEQGAGSREQGAGEQGEKTSAKGEAIGSPPVDANESRDDESEIAIRDDVEKICLTLADRIEANGSKRPTITKRWRDSARLMIDKDGRTLDQVLHAIDWCQSDEFWHVNILSVPKLREKYDQLRLAATRQRGSTVASAAGRPSTATQRAAEGYALSERLAAQEAGR